MKALEATIVEPAVHRGVFPDSVQVQSNGIRCWNADTVQGSGPKPSRSEIRTSGSESYRDEGEETETQRLDYLGAAMPRKVQRGLHYD